MSSLSRLAMFLGVVGSITAVVHAYIWLRLVRDPAWPAPWRSRATWTLMALAVSIFVALLVGRTLPRAVAAPVAWIGYVWLAAMFYLLVLLLVAEPFRLAFGGTTHFARTLAGTVVAACVAICAYGAISVASGPRVVRVTVPVRRLDPRLAGLRIVQISDVHVGPTLDRTFTEDVVRLVNSLEPDVVAITGDLIDGEVSRLAPDVEPLRGLKPRFATFFVLGNHEFYSGPGEWAAHVASLGIVVLRNARESVERDGALIDIAGIDDPAGTPDLPRALAGRDTSRPVILLAHQPAAVEKAGEYGVDLVLAGHTHGGQLQPFGLLVRLAQPAVSGLHRFGETMLYVSSGTGYWGPPMRVFAPAEVTLIELVPATH